MPSSKTSGGFKPFGKLDRLLATLPTASLPQKSAQPTRPRAERDGRHQAEDDGALFEEAMADVRPLARDHRLTSGNTAKPPYDVECTEDIESITKLERLIKDGEGFVVALTPEYIAGVGNRISPLIAERLHRGDFAIQGHIDLHGLGVPAAQEAVAAFLKESILAGKNAVLIVHGRGLSSPGQPVLKTRVIDWLTHGPWRKWVMAYASARSCDGGAGATYVLLRHQPLARRRRMRFSGKLTRHPKQQHPDNHRSSQRPRFKSKQKRR